jgi:hypothetical protein
MTTIPCGVGEFRVYEFHPQLPVAPLLTCRRAQHAREFVRAAAKDQAAKRAAIDSRKRGTFHVPAAADPTRYAPRLAG